MTAPPALRVVQAGFATTVQDRGRRGLTHLGVPTAGAVDRRTHDLMNRLVGNPPDAATIETMGALILEALRPLVIASSTDASRHTIAAGTRLRVDVPPGSVWAYLAVRGGIDVDPVLGSRSQDTLGGIGPAAIDVDSLVPVGPDPGTTLAVDHAPLRGSAEARVRVWDGPQHDWFIGGIQSLIRRPWRITSELSRVGVRLEAGEFDRSTRSQPQMQSIGLTPGAVQITPAGEPIVMLANHPTTGGYPVIAVVEPADLADVVQTRPGSLVQFRRA
ncbi:MAG: biotin-dependent carboxyltransferase family protein [Ilumatobacteraceae bacterium]